ncbi:translation initiation factor eIF-5A [Exidia glandulosa HHB12029]|uniref:Translation initiation factor eIF-5A n=1 Tax=Exidia glandulosa HHB12029 TaxID=1314781 RepID=A0A165JKI3_EXIGL|nr:translation initiation factor eIF-5A [Exidia glandulosa HHB12029]
MLLILTRPSARRVEEEHHVEAASGSGASLTFPMQCSALRKGGHVIVDMSTSKTGKHGHAKVHIIASDIFTGKKLEDVSPSTHNMDDDVKIPEGDIGKQIETEFKEGKELLITVVAAMGEEQAIAIRATSAAKP